MICKFCGAKLSAKEKFCPKCGENVQRTLFEGGNGFWDIVEMKTTVRIDPPPVTPIRVIETTKAVPARKSVMICTALCVLSVLCLIAAVIVSLSTGKSVKRLEESFNSHIISEASFGVPEKTVAFEQIVPTSVPALRVGETPAVEDFSAVQENNQESTAPVATEMSSVEADYLADTDEPDASVEEAIIGQGNPEAENPWQRWSPWNKKG